MKLRAAMLHRWARPDDAMKRGFSAHSHSNSILSGRSRRSLTQEMINEIVDSIVNEIVHDIVNDIVNEIGGEIGSGQEERKKWPEVTRSARSVFHWTGAVRLIE